MKYVSSFSCLFGINLQQYEREIEAMVGRVYPEDTDRFFF